MTDGLGRGSERELGAPAGWLGLSADDRCLLVAYVSRFGEEISELHTDVRVGVCPGSDEGSGDEFLDAYAAKVSPLRIDAMVRTPFGWRLLELKPDAGYVALGQVLCYRFYVQRCLPEVCPVEALVVTTTCQVPIWRVFHEYNITVVELGNVLELECSLG